MLSCLIFCALRGPALQSSQIEVPAFTAYGVPNRDGLRVSADGIQNWADPNEAIQWHGYWKKGTLKPTLNVRLPEGQSAQLRITIGGQVGVDRAAGFTHDRYGTIAGASTASVKGKGDELVSVPFDEVMIQNQGYQVICVQAIATTGPAYPSIESLTLSGTATDGAQFNLKERRNNASVHLSYPIDKDDQVAWFYNEVTPRTDPLYTYYEVCGFSRGYFGIQVNSPTERRIIFSVWDAGSGDDPSKVPEGLRTKLIAKGEDVEASAFGNEGTGGHSHAVYPWVKDATYRFLVGAKVDGNATIYTGYFFDPEQKKWMLIASFRAPKDGKLLRGLYSFDENFGGSTGDQERRAEFGNQWIGTADGDWRRLVQAKFSHDATGKEDRLDYAAKAIGGKFSLRTGGFLDEPKTDFGAILIRDQKGEQPKDLKLPPADGR